MFGDTPLVMVEDDETLARVCGELALQPVIGVDTESDSFHHYQEKVCLVQLSGPDADYIVDPLQLTGLDPLRELLQDPAVRKVLHGADYDVVCLKRDFDIHLTNVFDTMIAAQFLAFPRFGLADLIHHFFGVKLDKRYQRHDWSERPLLEDHLQYARGDTHWLLALAEVLEHKLSAAGRLRAAREECAVLERREWTGRVAHPAEFLKIKGAGTLDAEALRVLRALWTYRDDQARQSDRPAFKVIPGEVLVQVAQRRPREMDELAECIRASSPLFRRHGPALVAAVKAGLADERPLPEPPPREVEDRPVRGRKLRNESLMAALKSWRNGIVEREGINPVVVANNQLLKEIATHAPATREALAAIDGIRAWQVETWGPQLLELVQQDHERQGAPSRKSRRRRRRRQDGASE